AEPDSLVPRRETPLPLVQGAVLGNARLCSEPAKAGVVCGMAAGLAGMAVPICEDRIVGFASGVFCASVSSAKPEAVMEASARSDEGGR
ncbi:MAG: hypothetical protein ACJ74Y_00120, partial [Bryobacteraceae bacterium]